MLSIGLMSGTSMDGIDAALLKTDGSPLEVQELGHTSLPYDLETKLMLKAAEYTVQQCRGDMIQAHHHYPSMAKSYLEQVLKISDHNLSYHVSSLSLENVIKHSTTLHSNTVTKLLKETGYNAKQIDIIGYHGQTLFHCPSIKTSIVIGNGQSLADEFNVPVVHDFRKQDIAAGGQGAPFAPLYHHALAIRDQKIPLAVVNCGGIANISLINSFDELELIGFDTGPGNGLIDRFIRQYTQGKEHMDTDGQYGKLGTVNFKILDLLYEKSIIKDSNNFFSMKPPKSLDSHDMELIPELAELSLCDACATLEAFTADSIVQSLDWVTKELPTTWILVGGGWKNPIIRYQLEIRLKQKLKKVLIQTAAEAGWNSDAMEAQIFAYLAVRSLQNKPLSLPNITSVSQPMSGGTIYFPQG